MEPSNEFSDLVAMIAQRNHGLCLSGGAKNSDLLWGYYARKIKHDVIHWSFVGHKTAAAAADLIVLSDADLQLADPYCRRANQTLHRTFPPRAHLVRNLLLRSWYQVCASTGCYAISTFNLPIGVVIPIGDTLDAACQVDGGTAWAVQMFIDRFDAAPCACYVFDQIAGYWFKWHSGWRRIYAPPVPEGVWAGIGKRDLVMLGRLAIRSLLDPHLNPL